MLSKVIYLVMRKSRDGEPVAVKRTYQPSTTLTVPGESIVIAAPHAKEIDNSHTTPSPTPPVAAIATTLQPPAASTQEMGKL